MSFTDSILLASQIRTNRRLNKMEADLAIHMSVVEKQQREQEQLKQRREAMFWIREHLEKVAPRIKSDGFYGSYVMGLINVRISVNQITPASFSDLADKEHCFRLLRAVEELTNRSRSAISENQRDEVDNILKMTGAISHAENLTSWLKIRNLTPATPWYLRLTNHGALFWIAMLFGLQAALLIPYLAIDNFTLSNLEAACTFMSVLASFIAIRGIWSSIKSHFAWKKIHTIGNANGAFLSAPIRREALSEQIATEQSWLRQYEIGKIPSSVDEANRLEIQLSEELQQLLTKYHLSVNNA